MYTPDTGQTHRYPDTGDQSLQETRILLLLAWDVYSVIALSDRGVFEAIDAATELPRLINHHYLHTPISGHQMETRPRIFTDLLKVADNDWRQNKV